MGDVAATAHQPGIVLLLLHHEAQELLGSVRVLAVLHDHLVEEQIRLGRHADRADREGRMIDVSRQVANLGVGRVLGGVIDRDAVVRDTDLAVEESLVVVRVKPGQRARDEGGVHLLGVLQRLDRLGAVDHDLVVGIDQFAAEGPDQPVGPQAVAGGIAQREAGRRALGMQRLEHLQEAIHVLREGVESGRLQLALAVDHRPACRTQWHANPLLAVRAQIGLAGRVPAAVLLAEVLAQVGDVDQLVGVEVGIVVGRQDDVGSGAGVGRDRGLGPNVFPAFVVDPHLDAGLLGELLDVDHVGVDVTLDETAPAQHAQLGAFLRLEAQALGVNGGRHDSGTGADRGSGGNAGRTFKKFAAVEQVHGVTPGGEDGWKAEG